MRYTEPAQKTLPFWKQEHIGQYNSPLIMLCNSYSRLLGRWPGKPPAYSELEKELEAAEMVYMRIRPANNGRGESINIVVGRIEVYGSIDTNNDGFLRIWARKVSYADNRTRATVVSRGFRVAVQGVFIYEGSDHGAVERKNQDVRSGLHAARLLEIRDQLAQPGERSADEDDEWQPSTAENDLLVTLQQYIDVEYAQDEMTARQTPPFSYVSIKAEARRVVYRQFYRLRMTDGDYSRLQELAPGLLRFAAEGEEEGVMAQVVDLSPTSGEPEIIVSVEKQASHIEFPPTGQLYLTALPTLQRVRGSVLDGLRQGTTANPWLLGVASGEYDYPDFVPGNEEPPPAEHPPTASQLKAFQMGASTPDYVLTLGPPGTGKTTVILNWVRHLVAQGERVLVTSQNNKAVDNVLERLAEEKDLQCVRIGSETKVSSNLHPILVDNAATALQERLAANIDTTIEYLQQCQQYFNELQANLGQLAEQINACQDLVQRRDKQVASKLQPSQKNLQEESTKRQEIETKLLGLKAAIKRLEEKRLGWKHKHWLIKPVALIALPVIASKKQVLSWRVGRGEKILADSIERCERLQTKVTAITQAIANLNEDLQQAIKRRAECIPPTPASPYERVDFGLDLSDEYLQLNEQIVTEKIGRLTAWQQVVQEWKDALGSMRQQALYQISLEMVDVVGATCIGINTNPAFRSVPFNTTIVDESGQIQLHNLIVPLSRSSRSILVGDHKQLPPVVQDELIEELESRDVDTALMKESWFEQLWDVTGKDRKVILDTQYRCPAVISNYISKAFYDDEYFAGKGMEKKQPLFSFTNSPLVFIDTSNMPPQERAEKSFYGDGRNQVQDNPLETRLVVSLLERALAEKPELGDGEIGIVVPYKNHVQAIQTAIRKAQRAGRLAALKAPVFELVASVDSFQGQERNLIIMTSTRSNPSGTVGFLKDWRRLNVGMTRAKAQLIMIGDMHTLATERPRKNGEPDRASEYKQAMAMLGRFVKQHGQFIDLRQWQQTGFFEQQKHD